MNKFRHFINHIQLYRDYFCGAEFILQLSNSVVYNNSNTIAVYVLTVPDCESSYLALVFNILRTPARDADQFPYLADAHVVEDLIGARRAHFLGPADPTFHLVRDRTGRVRTGIVATVVGKGWTNRCIHIITLSVFTNIFTIDTP